MSFSPPVSALLTVVFGLTGAGYLAFAVRPGGGAVARAGDVLHLLMSAAMLSMPWPWGRAVAPPEVQVLVFGAGTAFYAVLLAAGDRVAGHGHEGGRPVLGYHVVMMAAMVVMALMMTGGTAGSSMAGMDMGSAMTGPFSAGAARATSWALAAVFALGTAWMLVRLLRAGRSAHPGAARADDALLLVMSAGMALAFAA